MRISTAQIMAQAKPSSVLRPVDQYMAESGLSPKAVSTGTTIMANRPQAKPML